MKKNRKVLIIYTGGTFGMSAPHSGSALATPDLEPAVLAKILRDRVPELDGIAHCDVEIVLNCDSAHIGPREWNLLAKVIQKSWRGYDGVVLLHGTDTMAYTASALSFLLRPCLKPVIMTGAQRPLMALRTDARRNLISAVEIAAHGPRELVNQVNVFFDNRLFLGNRVRKRSASEFGAFESPQAPEIAAVGTEIRYREAVGRVKELPAGRVKEMPRLKTGFKTRVKFRGSEKMLPAFNPNVALLHVTPGFPAKIIRERLLGGLDGLVLVVFPSGTAPTHEPEFIELLKSARRSGLPVVIVTEGHTEGVGPADAPSDAHPSTYAAGRRLLTEGGFWAGSMTPECAFVKASWILGQKDGARRFGAMWKTEFASEGI